MSAHLEIKFIERFIRKDKQDRYKQFLSSERTRRKFLQDLPHFKHFNWDLLEQVDSFGSKAVQERIRSLGLADQPCYALSENRAIDGKQLPLEKASLAIGGDGATILVFGDAQVIYYEGEPPHKRFICKLT